jgi:hypothetical protein
LLNDHDLELWKLKLGINQAGSDLIDRIRNSDPARVTRGWVDGNVHGRYPSQKMGHTIQFESHKGELPFIVSCCEFPATDDVLEYWDQPTTLRIRYKNKNGRMITVNNTPDFFLMHSGAAGFVECKLEENLVKLAKEQPNKFVRSAEGIWRCPPGEEEAAKFGLYYKVVSSAQIDLKVYRNTVFLEDFLRANTPDVPAQAKASILKIVSAKESLYLSDLLTLNAEVGGESDFIYQLIASGLLYVDLSAEALIDRERVRVFSSKEVSGSHTVPRLPKSEFIKLKLGETIHWGDDVFEIANLDHQNVWLIGSRDHNPKLSKKHLEQLIARGEVLQVAPQPVESQNLPWKKLMDDAKPEALKEAQRRYEIVMKYYRREGRLNVPVRTVKRWASQYRQAEFIYGNGLFGLLPRWAKRGDRSSLRLSSKVTNLMTDLIKNDYESNVQCGMLVVYGKLRLKCSEIGEKPPSYKTFANYIHKRPNTSKTWHAWVARPLMTASPFITTWTRILPATVIAPLRFVT